MGLPYNAVQINIKTAKFTKTTFTFSIPSRAAQTCVSQIEGRLKAKPDAGRGKIRPETSACDITR